MRQFLKDGNEKKIFFKIYELLHQYKTDLTMKSYCLGVLSFMFVDDKGGDYYNTARRYLFDPWDEDGLKIKTKYDSVGGKILNHAKNVAKDEIAFNLSYKDNPVAELIHNNEIYSELISIVRAGIDQKQYAEFSFADIRSYAKMRDSKRFLLAMVCGIYGVAAQVSFSKDQKYIELLSELLANNGQQIKHLYQYSKNTLFKVGQSSTYGVLETLYHAGPPDNINRDCDPFTLLDAADIYYFHKLKWGHSDQGNMDIEYSYRYSNVAYEEYQSPQAAWNMGYIWQTQGRQAADKEYRFNIEAFKSVVQKEENYLNKALDYFIFAARHDYAEAYNSIGNICYKLLTEEKYYPLVCSKLISFAEELSYKKNFEKTDDVDKLKGIILESQEICYRNAAHRYSINGMSNYYKLLLKKLKAQKGSVPLRKFEKDNQETVAEIRKYLNILCEYRLPSAMIDAAAIHLHKHDINEWLHKNNITKDNKKLDEKTDYDFILEYYPNLPGGIESVVDLLEKATLNEIPSIQAAGAYYYLSVICFSEMEYHKADEYIKKAIAIAGKPTPQKRKQEAIKRLAKQAKKCAKAIKQGYYIEDN
ncbi:MAG: hypothetical protein J6O61_12055 [Butyrivibrio sp.]|uniref:hypothetical protein n=1 Tax=Butyrivibrio sp. TaxID=28121 RepID=UPI001B16BB67|nr:hypothetical protein [Butyrivibrio sp.]MBO6241550.1 hypothetical protein [Butyrivibrio sp.]